MCAWDLRQLSYPVYEGRLDHAAAPLRHTGLPKAVWFTSSKAMFLGCHDDYMIGQADNGAAPFSPAGVCVFKIWVSYLDLDKGHVTCAQSLQLRSRQGDAGQWPCNHLRTAMV